MILRQVHPDVSTWDSTDDDARDRIRQAYALARPRLLRVNLIASVDGSATGADGTSESLSNRADRSILGAIRSLADVVLIGAETFRAERYLLPRSARLAVLTRSGELGGTSVGERTDPVVTVLGPASAEAAARRSLPGVDVEFLQLPLEDGPLEDGRLDLTDAVDSLRAAGAESIVSEGGPSLVAQLLAADLVDELCLSTSPRLSATGHPVLADAGGRPRDLELLSLLVDQEGGTYARWRVVPLAVTVN